MNLKLKRTPGIYLVGFMDSGKSTIGSMLAKHLNWHFADIDAEIEAAQGVPIWEIFDTRGEAEFRRIEHQAVADRVRAVERGRATVVALGGGAFAQDVTRQLVSDHGVTVWLDCPFEIVERRVAQAAHRPLARDPVQFAELYRVRRESYSRADYRIAVESDDPAGPVEAICRLPLF